MGVMSPEGKNKGLALARVRAADLGETMSHDKLEAWSGRLGSYCKCIHTNTQTIECLQLGYRRCLLHLVVVKMPQVTPRGAVLLGP